MYATKIENSIPMIWKELCFDTILNQNELLYRHIVSIGDQWTDHYAVKKSIKSLKSTSSA